MKNLRSLLVAVILTPALACGIVESLTEPEPIFISITGVVRSVADGSPIAEARVRYGVDARPVALVWFDEDDTSRRGRYWVGHQQLCDEPFTAALEVYHRDFVTVTVFPTLRCTEDDQSHDIELQPRSG